MCKFISTVYPLSKYLDLKFILHISIFLKLLFCKGSEYDSYGLYYI